MATLNVKIEGLKELGQKMQSLGKKISNRIAVKAMRQGGAIVRDTARAKAPVLQENVPHRKKGTLKKAITTRTKIKNGKAETIVWVKKLTDKQISRFKGKSGRSGAYNPNDPYYWRFVEFGTSKMAAKPFMRPAFEQSKQQAAKAITETLRTEIHKEATS
ncbi:HK97-gp10 family putative phage morphogenesis protein [Mannheimia indoligenes]|uniref:HK97-gp10 family putative phage morphogenesis protein n=1 Tax=Mannheimia indoligenes TaxID=3103145 RepID=UPI002FE51211